MRTTMDWHNVADEVPEKRGKYLLALPNGAGVCDFTVAEWIKGGESVTLTKYKGEDVPRFEDFDNWLAEYLSRNYVSVTAPRDSFYMIANDSFIDEGNFPNCAEVIIDIVNELRSGSDPVFWAELPEAPAGYQHPYDYADKEMFDLKARKEMEDTQRRQRYAQFISTNQMAKSFVNFAEKRKTILNERDGNTWTGEPFHAVHFQGFRFNPIDNYRMYALTVQLLITLMALQDKVSQEEVDEAEKARVRNNSKPMDALIEKITKIISESDPCGLMSDWHDRQVKYLAIKFACKEVNVEELFSEYRVNAVTKFDNVLAFSRAKNTWRLQRRLQNTIRLHKLGCPEILYNVELLKVLMELVCVIQPSNAYTDEFGPNYGVWPDGTNCEIKDEDDEGEDGDGDEDEDNAGK